jgi:hypothetical protein
MPADGLLLSFVRNAPLHRQRSAMRLDLRPTFGWCRSYFQPPIMASTNFVLSSRLQVAPSTLSRTGKYGTLGQALYTQARGNKSKANTNLCIQITNKSELFWVESTPMSTQMKRHNSNAAQHSKNNLMPLSQMQSTFQGSSSQSFQTDSLLFIFGLRHPIFQKGLDRP